MPRCHHEMTFAGPKAIVCGYIRTVKHYIGVFVYINATSVHHQGQPWDEGIDIARSFLSTVSVTDSFLVALLFNLWDCAITACNVVSE